MRSYHSLQESSKTEETSEESADRSLVGAGSGRCDGWCAGCHLGNAAGGCGRCNDESVGLGDLQSFPLVAEGCGGQKESGTNLGRRRHLNRSRLALSLLESDCNINLLGESDANDLETKSDYILKRMAWDYKPQ